MGDNDEQQLQNILNDAQQFIDEVKSISSTDVENDVRNFANHKPTVKPVKNIGLRIVNYHENFEGKSYNIRYVAYHVPSPKKSTYR